MAFPTHSPDGKIEYVVNEEWLPEAARILYNFLWSRYLKLKAEESRMEAETNADLQVEQRATRDGDDGMTSPMETMEGVQWLSYVLSMRKMM